MAYVCTRICLLLYNSIFVNTIDYRSIGCSSNLLALALAVALAVASAPEFHLRFMCERCETSKVDSSGMYHNILLYSWVSLI